MPCPKLGAEDSKQYVGDPCEGSSFLPPDVQKLWRNNLFEPLAYIYATVHRMEHVLAYIYAIRSERVKNAFFLT